MNLTSGGYEWTPPDALRNALLIADETALPAAKGILERLSRQEKSASGSGPF
ncbi:hypothetical protein WDV93_26015 [Pantoea ananatis]